MTPHDRAPLPSPDQNFMHPQPDELTNPERESIANRVGVTTATMYPDWYPGEIPEGQEPTVDKLRGDLALQTIGSTLEQGFSTVVVDGGSSPAFLEALGGTTAVVLSQEEQGMSLGRQQAFKAAAELDNVEVIAWLEPEKLSLATDGLIDPSKAILDGEADIVVPIRDQAAFDSYPDYQTGFEQESNRLFNSLLRRFDLYPKDAPDIDAWFGPRFFKNTPQMLELFTKNYEFTADKQTGLARKAPGLWANALFLPLVAALHEGYRIGGVPVDYRHPADQTALEQNSPAFEEKRSFQQKSILFTVVHFIRMLEGQGTPRLHEVGYAERHQAV